MKGKIKRILLAEDDRVTSFLIKKQLEQSGYVVMTAANGLEALNIIGSMPVDLLVTDVVMPEMDGVDLYLALKDNPLTAKIPIIIATDKQMFQDSFMSLGVNHFVPKMSDVDLLLAKIEEVSNVVEKSRLFRKVLICGTNKDVNAQMQAALLQKEDCLTTVVSSPIDIVSKALLMVPHLLLIDVMMEGDIMTNEILSAMRSFGRLKNTVFMTYVISSDLDAEAADKAGRPLDVRIAECRAAGALHHLGQFNQMTFLNDLQNMIEG